MEGNNHCMEENNHCMHEGNNPTAWKEITEVTPAWEGNVVKNTADFLIR